MRSTIEIKEEIDKLRIRQSELNTQKLQTEADIKVNEAKFVDGNATVDELNQGRSKLASLTESIRSFARREQDLVNELGNAEAAESASAEVYVQIRQDVAAGASPVPSIDARFNRKPDDSVFSNIDRLAAAERARGGVK
jgi:hypothetical protein